MSADDIRQDFAASLEELTFNSKPIITNLTIIAQENLQHAQVISKVIENRIRKAAPPHKLPALYLLDSICKNVGSPYTVYFGKDLYKTFLETYTLVDPILRRKMEELLRTWKLPLPGSQTANPAFPHEVTMRIDNALVKARHALQQLREREQGHRNYEMDRQYAQQSSLYNASTLSRADPQQYLNSSTSEMSQAPSNAPPVALPVHSSEESLLAHINTLLLVARSRHHLDPSDSAALTQIAALEQLQEILQSASLPHGQINAIREQLQRLSEQQENSYNVHPTTEFPTILHDPPLDLGDATSLIASLHSAGLVDSAITMNSDTQNRRIDQSESMLAINEALAKSMTFHDLELTAASIQKPRPHLISLLYQNLPKQCSICGKRFPDDDNGRTRRQTHVDWHFRVNKKLKDNTSRASSRNWYLGEEEWLADRHILDDQIDVAPTISMANKAVKTNKDYRLSKVPVPTDPLMASIPCPICKERFKSMWDEEREEWIWPNAMAAGGKIYHATCFKDTTNASNSQFQETAPTAEPGLPHKRTAAQAKLDS